MIFWYLSAGVKHDKNVSGGQLKQRFVCTGGIESCQFFCTGGMESCQFYLYRVWEVVSFICTGVWKVVSLSVPGGGFEAYSVYSGEGWGLSLHCPIQERGAIKKPIIRLVAIAVSSLCPLVHSGTSPCTNIPIILSYIMCTFSPTFNIKTVSTTE